MRTNKKPEPRYTHGGNKAQAISKKEELRRAVLSCLLWEDEFYESGVSIATRIADLSLCVDAKDVHDLAIEARNEQKLRHAPLWLVKSLFESDIAESRVLAGQALETVIQRADEPAEFLSMWWKDGRRPVPAAAKRALANALTKFDDYQLLKWRRPKDAIKMRDVLRLVHPKPRDELQAKVFKNIVADTVTESPDTWEVELSQSKDKKYSWTRLLKERKLGGLALLRNLRNMIQADVDKSLIVDALHQMRVHRVLPMRFISAARHAPQLEEALDMLFIRAANAAKKLPGRTIIIVDISGSMHNRVSRRSEMTRMHAACALAAIGRTMCDDVAIYATAGNDARREHATTLVPSRRGMALADAIAGQGSKIGGGGIFLKQVMDYVYPLEKKADRIIVITDEQDCDHGNQNHPSKANAFGTRNYILNLSTYDCGIAYDKWVHVNGWSERLFDYIREIEGAQQ